MLAKSYALALRGSSWEKQPSRFGHLKPPLLLQKTNQFLWKAFWWMVRNRKWVFSKKMGQHKTASKFFVHIWPLCFWNAKCLLVILTTVNMSSVFRIVRGGGWQILRNYKEQAFHKYKVLKSTVLTVQANVWLFRYACLLEINGTYS